MSEYYEQNNNFPSNGGESEGNRKRKAGGSRTLETLAEFLKERDITAKFCEWKQKPILTDNKTGRELNIKYITEDFQSLNEELKPKVIDASLSVLARQHKYDEALEALLSLGKDETKNADKYDPQTNYFNRIGAKISDETEAITNETTGEVLPECYAGLIVKYTFLGLILSAFNGTEFGGSILYGVPFVPSLWSYANQTGKDQFFNNLIIALTGSQRLYADLNCMPDDTADRKDTETACSSWLGHISEANRMWKKHSTDQVKKAISISKYERHSYYGHYVEPVPKRCFYCISSNSPQMLRDVENTRFGVLHTKEHDFSAYVRSSEGHADIRNAARQALVILQEYQKKNAPLRDALILPETVKKAFAAKNETARFIPGYSRFAAEWADWIAEAVWSRLANDKTVTAKQIYRQIVNLGGRGSGVPSGSIIYRLEEQQFKDFLPILVSEKLIFKFKPYACCNNVYYAQNEDAAKRLANIGKQMQLADDDACQDPCIITEDGEVIEDLPDIT